MSNTHFTLTPIFNVGVIAVAGLVASALLLVSKPRPLVSVALGIVAGVVTGALQRRSVSLSPAAFSGAKSALEVRQVFMSNQPGKLSIMLLWVTSVALLVVALAQVGSPLVAVVAGYASFMFARDLVSFGAIGAVRRSGE